MKKVSVIVAIYNKEDYIKECIESLLSQTLKEIEIICVDDGSTDKSVSIVKEYEKNYPDKIKLYQNEQNRGIGYTRNKGISFSKGEYLGFVDADDFVEPFMYEKYYEYAKENKCDMVMGSYTKVFPNHKEEVPIPSFKEGSPKEYAEILYLMEYGPCNKLFQSSLIKENQIHFEENLKYEDMPFVAHALSFANKVGGVKESYYNYRILKESETTTMDERVFDMLKVMELVNGYYKDFPLKEVEYLNINQITRYLLQQRYQKEKKIRKKFLKEGYVFLTTYFPNWKTNPIYKKEKFSKRIVKNSPFMLKWYCVIYSLLHR